MQHGGSDVSFDGKEYDGLDGTSEGNVETGWDRRHDRDGGGGDDGGDYEGRRNNNNRRNNGGDEGRRGNGIRAPIV